MKQAPKNVLGLWISVLSATVGLILEVLGAIIRLSVLLIVLGLYSLVCYAVLQGLLSGGSNEIGYSGPNPAGAFIVGILLFVGWVLLAAALAQGLFPSPPTGNKNRDGPGK
jgi:hypothetical protein